jgi:hypothetical protein
MPNATAPETDYHRRFGDIEEPLADVVAWAGLLDKIIEHDLSRYPEMSKRELSRLAEEFEHVNDELKEAVNRMDSIYHEREEEEAPQ